MNIEIIKGTETPVIKYFSEPEIDSIIVQRLCIHKRDGSIQHMELIDAEVARKLQRERDKAREKIKRQAERIRQLEGATNHAGGTPLSIALRERDEALMDRASGDIATMTINHYERLIKERDEARADAARLADILSGLELRSTEELARLEQELNEARAAIPAGEWVAYADHQRVHDAASRLLVAINKQIPIGDFDLIEAEYRTLKDAIYGKEAAK